MNKMTLWDNMNKMALFEEVPSPVRAKYSILRVTMYRYISM